MFSESPLALPESVYTSVSDQKRFFQAKFFLRRFLSWHFRSFVWDQCIRVLLPQCFARVLFMCACRVQGLQNHSFAFCISFYFKKSKNICLSSCIAFCIVLALDLLWSISQDFIQESLHLSFEENFAVAYPIFHGHNAFALIVRCAFYFMLCHNTISCMAIYLFRVIKPVKINA